MTEDKGDMKAIHLQGFNTNAWSYFQYGMLWVRWKQLYGPADLYETQRLSRSPRILLPLRLPAKQRV